MPRSLATEIGILALRLRIYLPERINLRTFSATLERLD